MTTNMQFACSDHGKLSMECWRHQWVWKFEREIRKRSKLMKVKPPLIALRAMWTNVNQCEPMWANRDLLSCAFFLYTCTLECTVRACTTTLYSKLYLDAPRMSTGVEVFVFFYWPHHWWWCTYVHKLECLLTSVIRLVPSQPCKLILFCLFIPIRKSFEEGSAS